MLTVEDAPRHDVQGKEDASTEDVSSTHGERSFDVFQVSSDSIL